MAVTPSTSSCQTHVGQPHGLAQDASPVGYSQGLRPLPPHETAGHDAVLETLRNDLNPDRFDLPAGREARMSYDEIVDFVLSTLDPASSQGLREDL